MSVSSIYNTHTALSKSYPTSQAKLPGDIPKLDQPSLKEDKFTKSQDTGKVPATYNANGALASANPRHGGCYRSLLIMAPEGGAYTPGGPNDDKEMVLNFGSISSDEYGLNHHPYQHEYDEYNAIFEEIYANVLSERGLRPPSGDLRNVTIKVGEIHKVYDEVMARVKSDERASELAASLGIEYAEVKTDAELRADFK